MKKVKIKSLPKAQLLGNLTPEQKKEYENRYVIYREQGSDPNEANKLAQVDASNFGTGPIYDFQPFLPDPDSGVIVAAGKRFPWEHVDVNTFNSWQENYMSDPDYVRRYNKMTPSQQELAKRMVEEDESLASYSSSLDDVKKWEKNWYSQRAKLPQFTDVANKRLSLVESVNMQPWGDHWMFSAHHPDAGGVYVPYDNSVNIPSYSFSNPSLFTHERSHWYDWNAPQNDDMINTSYFNQDKVTTPVYNEEDILLNSIIPGEYMLPYGVAEPLRLGENDTKTYDTESEKIIANLPNASDDVSSGSSVKIPFKGETRMFGNKKGNLEYYYNPTEVRARLNEWRFQHKIDPTKNYTNEELQQMIDDDIKSGRGGNFDLYKVVRGRGDLLKQIHDAYVSNDVKQDEQFPKAQIGLSKSKKKKDPGFKILTDTNGKYVFIKT